MGRIVGRVPLALVLLVSVLGFGTIFGPGLIAKVSAAGGGEDKIIVQLQEPILIERGVDLFNATTEPGDFIERTWTVKNTSERNTYCLIASTGLTVTDKRIVHMNATIFADGVSVPGVISMSPKAKKQILVRVTIFSTTPRIDPGTELEVTFSPPTRTSCPAPQKG
ncbi:MAG: hypothetical protein Greene071421_335 [Parcubacteria group bacterium Greene0714_21]|nr:MAG: hypothetical protein Greene041639_153 [Parcubacteria group bacterium Greene0416_39]TSC98036.1 MAG: hypothetical protein Greene101447_199 [Parcubacteria group bacterium Greene1014_47]TSD04173.1 MAG: hypothetical protein Greene071421_335 [Parcubacteria group bacterium Greene0714_21]